MGCGHSKIIIYRKSSANHETDSNCDETPEEKEDITKGVQIEENHQEQLLKFSPNHNLINHHQQPFPYTNLLAYQSITASQIDFFRMLDEKIANGPDYDENEDTDAKSQRTISDLQKIDTKRFPMSYTTQEPPRWNMSYDDRRYYPYYNCYPYQYDYNQLEPPAGSIYSANHRFSDWSEQHPMNLNLPNPSVFYNQSSYRKPPYID